MVIKTISQWEEIQAGIGAYGFFITLVAQSRKLGVDLWIGLCFTETINELILDDLLEILFRIIEHTVVLRTRQHTEKID